jgi:hypothetical protein
MNGAAADDVWGDDGDSVDCPTDLTRESEVRRKGFHNVRA